MTSRREGRGARGRRRQSAGRCALHYTGGGDMSRVFAKNLNFSLFCLVNSIIFCQNVAAGEMRCLRMSKLEDFSSRSHIFSDTQGIGLVSHNYCFDINDYFIDSFFALIMEKVGILNNTFFITGELLNGLGGSPAAVGARLTCNLCVRPVRRGRIASY